MELRVDGKTAVVTGAASGIGHAIARDLAKSGATVVVSNLDAEKAEAAATDTGHCALACGADVADAAAAEVLVGFATERTGKRDLLVDNPMICGPPGPVGDDALEECARSSL